MYERALIDIQTAKELFQIADKHHKPFTHPPLTRYSRPRAVNRRIEMNDAISGIVRTSASNTASAAKLDQETAKSAEQVSGGLNNAAESSVSSKYDTLDLSREYLKYKTQSDNKALSDKTSQMNSTVLSQAASSTKKKNARDRLDPDHEPDMQELLFDKEVSGKDRAQEADEKNPESEPEVTENPEPVQLTVGNLNLIALSKKRFR